MCLCVKRKIRTSEARGSDRDKGKYASLLKEERDREIKGYISCVEVHSL